jgi:threonyl-tRNA synthetase
MKKIEKIRHSLAHVLAAAIQNLYPKVKFGIGPAIDNGFYYDFEFENPISEKDLPKIEKEMRKIIKKNMSFEKINLSDKEIKEKFQDQPYKQELMKELEEKPSFYKNDDFIDLCRGPHISSTKEINPKAFKLTKVAGAYWKGNEKNKMLTRIYGLAFENEKELKDYLVMLEEAKKRDHVKLGKKMELFLFDEEVGPGLPIWQPKGAALIQTMKDFLREELTKEDYKWLITPHIGKIDLWKTSGHWDFYQESLYSPMQVEDDQYLIKPMNCPFHIKVYNSDIRSYRDLPIKYAEFGTVYRYEKSGELHGLTRVRSFTQDDAHIWCTEEQLFKEVNKLLKQSFHIFDVFGFKEFKVYLSTRPDKYVGSDKGWKNATGALKKTLEEENINFLIDEGGGAFYGPKIDIKVKDSLGREHQCTTIQIDFNLPERFDMSYINKEGEKEKPYMIHRALFGSIERFLGVLLENYAGDLPLWLAPEQIWVVPISEKNLDYAKKVHQELKDNNFKSILKDKDETLSKKIRKGEIQKIPYLLVVGDKEEKSNSVSPRFRGKNQGSIKLTKFIEERKIDIKNKK